MKVPSALEKSGGLPVEKIHEELARQSIQHLLHPTTSETAAQLRETATAAAKHVNPKDEIVKPEPSTVRRSCETCYFGPNKITQICPFPILDAASPTGELYIPIDSADALFCDGWVYDQLAGFLLDGRAFDAISVKTRNPEKIDPPNGREKLHALARKQLEK